jgi:vacuolar-type H+-ATPase subunit E/Vma4
VTLTDTATSTDPLAPVRSALIARAQAEAAALLSAADADAAATLTEAQRQVEESRAQARMQASADTAATLARQRSSARRQAREIVLAARREAYEELRKQARAAVAELRAASSYPALLDALRARLNTDLGQDVSVSEHPAGGLVGIGEYRRLEYGLAQLADAAVQRLGPEVEELWQP